MDDKDNAEMARWKSLLPYAGLPVICAALLLTRLRATGSYFLVLDVLLCIFGYFAMLSDIRKKLIPNRLLLAMLGAWVLVSLPPLFLITDTAIRHIVSGLIGFALGGIVLLLVYLVSRRGIGGGDVKLVAVSGLYLGTRGIMTVLLCGSILAGAVGLILILLKKISWRESIPLAPFLYVGILITVFAG